MISLGCYTIEDWSDPRSSILGNPYCVWMHTIHDVYRTADKNGSIK